MNVKAFLQRHPVALYFGIAFLIYYGGFLVGVVPKLLRGETMQSTDAFLLFPHIAPITTREELIYLLSRAAELKHGLTCIYLFDAYLLKNDVSEDGMTIAEGERRLFDELPVSCHPFSETRACR